MFRQANHANIQLHPIETLVDRIKSQILRRFSDSKVNFMIFTVFIIKEHSTRELKDAANAVLAIKRFQRERMSERANAPASLYTIRILIANVIHFIHNNIHIHAFIYTYHLVDIKPLHFGNYIGASFFCFGWLYCFSLNCVRWKEERERERFHAIRQ